MRTLIDNELRLIKDRVAVAPVIAEFRSILLEMSGKKTLNLFSQALRGLEDGPAAEEHREAHLIAAGRICVIRCAGEAALWLLA